MLDKLIKKTDIIWTELGRIYPTLQNHKTPDIILNARLWRTAGRAWQEDMVIELGSKFLLHSANYRAIMYGVILPHEIAHIADYIIFGESEKTCGHGEGWRKIMVQLGLEPDPFHRMDIKK